MGAYGHQATAGGKEAQCWCACVWWLWLRWHDSSGHRVRTSKYSWKDPADPDKKHKGVTAAEYQHIIKSSMLPAAKKLFGRGKWQLLHDKASPHKAKSTQACLAAAGITVVQEWPSNSPDLNPIENCWSYMQHKVNLLHPTDIESLTQAITQAWAELRAEYLQSLAASVPKRLDLVVAKEGGYNGY